MLNLPVSLLLLGTVWMLVIVISKPKKGKRKYNA